MNPRRRNVDIPEPSADFIPFVKNELKPGGTAHVDSGATHSSGVSLCEI